MGKYAVPDYIRAQKPKGKQVKKIGNGYYVYDCKNVKCEDGKWRVRTGDIIGCIREGVGFVPGEKYSGGDVRTVLEYGQYALAYEATKGELSTLKEFFDPLEATMLYTHALILFVNGYQPLKNVDRFLAMSYLSRKYPGLSLSSYMTTRLLGKLGAHEGRPMAYEAHLLSLAGTIGVGGHCFTSFSGENDLTEYGNKYLGTGEMRMNLLMAYDVDMNTPLYAKMFPGGMPDKTSVRDFLDAFSLPGKVFLMDCGFYGEENLGKIVAGGSDYVIPLSCNLREYKDIRDRMDYRESFVYRADRKLDPVFFFEDPGQGKDGPRVILYKDMDRSVAEEDCFRKRIGTSKDYTVEKLQELKPYFGSFVLRTSLRGESAQEIFEFYKKRWRIEDHYDLLKNRDGIEALGMRDYYVTQGLSLLILIEGRIESAFRKACAAAKVGAPDDVLLDARTVKIQLRKSTWVATEKSEKLISLFNALSCPLVGDLGLVT